MVKIRVQGLPEEVEEMIASFKQHYEMLNISDLYENRGESKFVRCYVEMKIK